MAIKVFVAGASGVIGRRLTLLLRDAGYAVSGTTRSAEKAEVLRAAGATPVVVDVFDAPALTRAVRAVGPEVVIHELTDLPPRLEPHLMKDALPRNARLRDEGTKNLVAAARAAGARRLIAQSLAWLYAPGREPHVEDHPLDLAGERASLVSVNGVAALERWTLGAAPLEGVVLRYGQLYGTDTGSTPEKAFLPLHVDAAASAAVLAIGKGRPGIYNIAEENPYASSEKARRELGWDPAFRRRED